MPGCPLAGQPEVTHRPEQDVSREPSAPSACSPLKAGRCRERAQAGRERGSLSTLRGPGPQHLRGRAPPAAGAEAPGGRLMNPSSPLSAIPGPRAGARRLLLGPWSSRWGDPPSTPRSLPLHDTLRDTRHGTPGRPSRAADACHELFKASPVPPRQDVVLTQARGCVCVLAGHLPRAARGSPSWTGHTVKDAASDLTARGAWPRWLWRNTNPDTAGGVQGAPQPLLAGGLSGGISRSLSPGTNISIALAYYNRITFQSQATPARLHDFGQKGKRRSGEPRWTLT